MNRLKLIIIAIFAVTAHLNHAAAFADGDSPYKWGLSTMRGYRPTMEDTHKIELNYKGSPKQAFFGIYDGHGGKNAANFTADNLHKKIAEYGLVDGFKQTDKAFLDAWVWGDRSGTTVVVAVTEQQPDGNLKLSFAWAGDARGILVDENGKELLATKDHKPDDPAEKARIEAAGGFVSTGDVARVNDFIAVSRAIGDWDFKNPNELITSTPDVKEIMLDRKPVYIILACDGVWDKLSNEEAAKIVVDTFAKKPELKQDSVLPHFKPIEEEGNDNIAIMAARALRDEALKRGSRDNISAIVVKIDWQSQEQIDAARSNESSSESGVSLESISQGVGKLLLQKSITASTDADIQSVYNILRSVPNSIASENDLEYTLMYIQGARVLPGSSKMISVEDAGVVRELKLGDMLTQIAEGKDPFDIAQSGSTLQGGSSSSSVDPSAIFQGLHKVLEEGSIIESSDPDVQRVVRRLQNAQYIIDIDKDAARAIETIRDALALDGARKHVTINTEEKSKDVSMSDILSRLIKGADPLAVSLSDQEVKNELTAESASKGLGMILAQESITGSADPELREAVDLLGIAKMMADDDDLANAVQYIEQVRGMAASKRTIEIRDAAGKSTSFTLNNLLERILEGSRNPFMY
jgi:serine/threonine protein phosphatase PrpC